MTDLLLDTLFPSSPDQLVADCRALGAAGCWVYVLRHAANGADIGVGGWTIAHVDKMHANGLFAPGIVVPGNIPPTGQQAIDALRAMHCDLLLGSDLEQFSLPPTFWEDQLEGLEAAEGIRGIDYGTSSTLGIYDPGEPNWVAAWLRTGILNPIPTLPTGRLAWQFVNDVPAPSGVQYDVSIVDSSLVTISHLKGDISMFHPTIAGRVDDVYLSATGQLIHTWSILFAESPSSENWGGPAAGIVPGTLAAGWSPDGLHFLVRVVGKDGILYYRQEAFDAAIGIEHDWTALTTPAPGLPPASTVSTAPAVDPRVDKLVTDMVQVKSGFQNVARDAASAGATGV